jgi:hypothetical protein
MFSRTSEQRDPRQQRRGGLMPDETTSARGSLLTWVALLAALAALAGSLLLSIALNLKACPLCFYQRTFVMGVVGVMAVGLCVRGVRPGLLSLLSMPLAFAGFCVAVFHVYLEQKGTLECPLGLLGVGTAPVQSLVALSVLLVLLALDVVQHRREAGLTGLAGLMSAVLGMALAFASIKSVPPPPGVPPGGWPIPLNEDGCRPPYRPPQ